jgi:hypothetical protein
VRAELGVRQRAGVGISLQRDGEEEGGGGGRLEGKEKKGVVQRGEDSRLCKHKATAM